MTSVDVIVVCRSMLNYRERGVVMSVLMMVVCDLSRRTSSRRVSRVSDAFNESEAALPRPIRSAPHIKRISQCIHHHHQGGRSSSSHQGTDSAARASSIADRHDVIDNVAKITYDHDHDLDDLTMPVYHVHPALAREPTRK
jgi:hypothetical protein